MNQLINNLKSVFKPSEAALATFLETVHVRTIDKHQYFISEGQTCNEVGLVARGTFKMYYNVNEKEVVKGFAFDNDFIGSIASFLSKTPCRFNIIALEKSEIATIEHDQLNWLVQKHGEWEYLRKVILEDQLIKMENRERSLITDPPEIRFRKLTEEHPKIFKRVPLQYIASYLSITPETLSRYRSRNSTIE
ncbi:MAG: Crp/Fnr family transcriptional regulator [Fulvivirga sp.]|uniref:Crp/Fnr family transcriptional regulator n=1 Tax=Fulvivirga sp. TaxID=1931237 RepID=UPI0032EDE444